MPDAPKTARYRTTPAPKAALRELLEATLDWAHGGIGERQLLVGGTGYRLTHLADGAAGAAALLCEAPPGTAIPEYLERRRIREMTGTTSGRNLVIFTDAAHSVLVWSWVTTGDMGTRVYRELSFRPGQAWGPLRPVLESIAAGSEDLPPRRLRRAAIRRGTAPASCAPHAAAVPAPSARALLAAITDSLCTDGGGHDRTGAPQMIQDLIEGAVDRTTIRDQWSALLRLRVLDRACGEGPWLDSALTIVAAAYEAVLERMRSAVDDLDRGSPAPRAERLGDLRRLVQRAGGWRDPAARRSFSTELALLHNLFGCDERPSRVAACRARLASRLGAAADSGLMAVNVRTCAPEHAAGDPESSPDRTDAAPTDELEIVTVGIETVLGMHMEGELDLVDLGRTMTAAERKLTTGSGPLLRAGHLIERVR